MELKSKEIAESKESGEELRKRVGLPVRGAMEENVEDEIEIKEELVEDSIVEECAKTIVETPVEEVIETKKKDLIEATQVVDRISTDELLDYTAEDELSHVAEETKTTYALQDKIGEGAFGTVHRAISSNGEEVAIKILKDFSGLEEEVQNLRELNHPNIVAVKEVFDQEEGKGIVMEYVAGKTLADVIKERKGVDILNWYSAALPLLSALDYAHNLGIIHGDIKPSNILVGNDSTVKICDFGLAQKLDLSEKASLSLSLNSQNESEGLAGTIKYMAPELYQNSGSTPNKLTDTYSVALTIYELLVGRLPEDLEDNPFFTDSKKGEITKKLLQGTRGKSKREKLKNIKKQIHDELLDELHHQIFEINHSKNPEKEKLKQLVRNNIQLYKPITSTISSTLDKNVNALSLFTPEEFKELPEIADCWYSYYWGHTADSGLLEKNERKKALRKLQKFEAYIDETYVSDLITKIEEEEKLNHEAQKKKEKDLEKKTKQDSEERKLKNSENEFQNQLEEILNSFTKQELKILKRDKFNNFLDLRKEYLDTKAIADEELMNEEHIKDYSHILGSAVGIAGLIAATYAIHLFSPLPLTDNIELIQGISGILGTGIAGYMMGYYTGQSGYPKENKNVIDARKRLPELAKKLKQQLLGDYFSTKIYKLKCPPQIIQNGKILQNPQKDTYISARDKIVQTFNLLDTTVQKEEQEKTIESTTIGMQKVDVEYQARLEGKQVKIDYTSKPSRRTNSSGPK